MIENFRELNDSRKKNDKMKKIENQENIDNQTFVYLPELNDQNRPSGRTQNLPRVGVPDITQVTKPKILNSLTTASAHNVNQTDSINRGPPPKQAQRKKKKSLAPQALHISNESPKPKNIGQEPSPKTEIVKLSREELELAVSKITSALGILDCNQF
jgi:hypothetical protein